MANKNYYYCVLLCLLHKSKRAVDRHVVKRRGDEPDAYGHLQLELRLIAIVVLS